MLRRRLVTRERRLEVTLHYARLECVSGGVAVVKYRARCDALVMYPHESKGDLSLIFAQLPIYVNRVFFVRGFFVVVAFREAAWRLSDKLSQGMI